MKLSKLKEELIECGLILMDVSRSALPNFKGALASPIALRNAAAGTLELLARDKCILFLLLGSLSTSIVMLVYYKLAVRGQQMWLQREMNASRALALALELELESMHAAMPKRSKSETSRSVRTLMTD